MAEFSIKKGATTLDSFDSDLERLTEKAVDKLKFKAKFKTDIDVGDEIKAYDKNAVLRFGGTITEIQKKKAWEVTCLGYGYELNNKWKLKVYENKSPEYIVEDIITDETNLTYSSTGSSGITITKFVANDYIYKIINEMRELCGWQTKTDPDKKFYFEESGATDNLISWTNGTHISIQKWTLDPSGMYNHVKIKGDYANYNTSESFNATADQTDFMISYKPIGSVKVTVNGTEKDGLSPEFGDYDIDTDQKKIIFDTGLNLNDAVVIYYSYQIPIVVSAQDEDSIRSYTEIFQEIQAPHIKTFASARQYARQLLEVHTEPAYSVKFNRRGLDWTKVVGEQITIIDSQRGITEKLTIKKINWLYPAGVTVYEAGTLESDAIDWEAKIQERLKVLEKKIANEEIIMESRPIHHSLSVSLSFAIVKKQRAINDSGIWGHSTPANGSWGTAKWGDRRGAWTTI